MLADKPKLYWGDSCSLLLLEHAPNLESRINCSSLGSQMLRLNYLRLNILTLKNIQIHNFNA